MSTRVQVEREVLHIIGRDTDTDPSVGQMSEKLRNLDSLIVLAAYVVRYEEMAGGDSRTPRPEAALKVRPEDWKAILDVARYESNELRTGRLRYNSPLDILIYSLGSGGATVTMYSVLRLYSKALDVYKKQSDTDLHIQKNEAIKAFLTGEAGLSPKRRKSLLKKLIKAKTVDEELLILIDQASNAVVQIEDIRIERAP